MKTYVKGGLIAFVIGILLVILASLFIGGKCIGLSQDGTSCSSPQGFDAFVINLNTLLDNLGKVIFYFILPLIILGALIGWIIGKVKYK